VPTDFYKTNLLIFGTDIATVQANGFNAAKGVKVDLTAIIRR
jgi:hypothetical protein